MGKKEKTILLATIVALSLSVSVGVVLAWDVNVALWGAYGDNDTRCLAGAAGNRQGNPLYFYQWHHWVGYESPSQAYATIHESYHDASYAYTCGWCYIKFFDNWVHDSTSTVYIYPDGSYHA